MSEQKQVVVEAVREKDPAATDISVLLLLENLEGSSVYYAKFPPTEENEEGDNFFYVVVDGDGKARALHDGVEAIQDLSALLDVKKARLLRIRDFWLVQGVAAVLAVALVAGFLIVSASAGKIDERFAAMVTLVVGYYFGKNVTTGS